MSTLDTSPSAMVVEGLSAMVVEGLVSTLDTGPSAMVAEGGSIRILRSFFLFGRRSVEQKMEEGRGVARAAQLGVPVVIVCSVRDSACPWRSEQPYFQAMAENGVPLSSKLQSCSCDWAWRPRERDDGHDMAIAMVMSETTTTTVAVTGVVA